MELTLLITNYCRRIGLPIPYVLLVTGEYSSTRWATHRVLE